jgi:hypothetical protein
MATSSTVAAVKAALVDELQVLAIGSDDAARPAQVQVSYGRPPLDLRRSESVYFAEEMDTAEYEYRLSAGRRRRVVRWNLDLMVDSAVIADVEAAEIRAFEITSAVEDFLAAYAQPGEWPNTALTGESLSVLLVDMSVEHEESADGVLRVLVRMGLELTERLT